MKASQARVVLTGATGGIGQAAARTLADAGASLLLVGRSRAALTELARGLQAEARDASSVSWHVADIADAAALDALVRAARDWRANVLVHGAGVPAFGRLESLSAAELDAVMQVNLLAPIRLTQALLPWFKAQPRAQIIHVGSVLGRLGLPGYSAYCASKFGLRGFAEALRRELAGGPVRVQYLGPRTTRTAFNSPAAEAYNRATGTRSDAPELVARALLRLLESEAAERFLGFPESLAVRVNGLAPGALDAAFEPHRRSLPDVGEAAADPSTANPLS